MLVSEQTLQVPTGRRYGSRAAEHTLCPGGTTLGQTAQGIFCSGLIPFTLHLHSSYHEKDLGFY